MTGYSYYDGAGTQRYSHFSRPLSLTTTGQVTGPFKLTGPDVHWVSGYMGLIPPEWQSSLGGPALTGNCCLAIASVQSNGPSVSVFDPTTIASGSAKVVVGYPLGSELGPGEATTNTLYNLTTKVRGVVFPTGTRAVLFFGRHGTGTYCYGTGDECNDPADDSKGTHAYPYRYQVWAYDANDLLAVKNGYEAACCGGTLCRVDLQPAVRRQWRPAHDRRRGLRSGQQHDLRVAAMLRHELRARRSTPSRCRAARRLPFRIRRPTSRFSS